MKLPTSLPILPDRKLTDAEIISTAICSESISQVFDHRRPSVERAVKDAEMALQQANDALAGNETAQALYALQDDPLAFKAYLAEHDAEYWCQLRDAEAPVEVAKKALFDAKDALESLPFDEVKVTHETLLQLGERVGLRLGLALALQLSSSNLNPADFGLQYASAAQTRNAISVAMTQDAAADELVGRLVQALGIGKVPDPNAVEEAIAYALAQTNPALAEGGESQVPLRIPTI